MKIVIAAVAAAAMLAPVAHAGSATKYPPASDPGKLPPRPSGKKATLEVCKKKRCFKTIQKAVNASRGGDTIRVANGVYREAVVVKNRGRRGLRIIGNPKKPGKVVLDGKRLGPRGQNAFLVNRVNRVTINGFKARNYRANGFFFTTVTGYKMANLIAFRTGRYGLYAFNSKGGRIVNSEGSQVNDGAFYIGQTPPQTRPRRTIVKNVRGHESVIGFSGTNMRYVTITKSEFFNNAVGIVPNALDSERFPPDEHNVISDNDVFWNNFNYFHSAPFKIGTSQTSSGIRYNPGVGILLLGGRDHVVEDNRVYGNWLAGFAGIDGIALEENPQAISFDRNVIRGNAFGLDGTDLNGLDMAYDGSGSDNCFEANTGVARTLPANGSTFSPCPFSGKNPQDDGTRVAMIERAVSEDPERFWIRGEHAPKAGYRPLVHYSEDR